MSLSSLSVNSRCLALSMLMLPLEVFCRTPLVCIGGGGGGGEGDDRGLVCVLVAGRPLVAGRAFDAGWLLVAGWPLVAGRAFVA